MSEEVISLNCPNCGAPFGPIDGRTGDCKYCGSHLIVKLDDTVKVVQRPQVIDVDTKIPWPDEEIEESEPFDYYRLCKPILVICLIQLSIIAIYSVPVTTVAYTDDLDYYNYCNYASNLTPATQILQNNSELVWNVQYEKATVTMSLTQLWFHSGMWKANCIVHFDSQLLYHPPGHLVIIESTSAVLTYGYFIVATNQTGLKMWLTPTTGPNSGK